MVHTKSVLPSTIVIESSEREATRFIHEFTWRIGVSADLFRAALRSHEDYVSVAQKIMFKPLPYKVCPIEFIRLSFLHHRDACFP